MGSGKVLHIFSLALAFSKVRNFKKKKCFYAKEENNDAQEECGEAHDEKKAGEKEDNGEEENCEKDCEEAGEAENDAANGNPKEDCAQDYQKENDAKDGEEDCKEKNYQKENDDTQEAKKVISPTPLPARGVAVDHFLAFALNKRSDGSAIAWQGA